MSGGHAIVNFVPTWKATIEQQTLWNAIDAIKVQLQTDDWPGDADLRDALAQVWYWTMFSAAVIPPPSP